MENMREKGNKSEEAAVDYLTNKGFRIIKRNFYFGKEGEIDIIAEDGNCLVFIEVKSRYSKEYGSPESAITIKKIKALRRAAEGYLYINSIRDKECRFDVIAIDFSEKEMEIRHIVSAW